MPKNAIILAAGSGERFVPLSKDSPKALTEIRGERVIERLIKQLHEANITDITIVVGYMKEKFEYLRDQYNVRLVFNRDYLVTDSLISLNTVIDDVEDTYIIPSDIYASTNPFLRETKDSYFTVTETYHPGQWSLSVDRDGVVNAIFEEEPSDYGITGFAYVSPSDAKQFKKVIKRDAKVKSKRAFAWRNSVANNIKAFAFKIHVIEPDSIRSFNSLEELRMIEPRYNMKDQNKIITIICDVYKCLPQDIVDIQTLKKGMTNDSFLFTVNGERYVFRMPGMGTDKLINRKQEAAVYEAIEHLKIADSIFYIDPETGNKISRYYNNSRQLELEELPEAIAMIRDLHQSGIVLDHRFDIWERIEYYHSLCLENDAILFDDFDVIYKRIREVNAYLESCDRDDTIAHIDANLDNFIRLEDGRIKLLDWEYAGMADPLLDLAMLSLYSNFDESQIDGVVNVYFEGKAKREDKLVVYAYVALGGFLWALWTQFKQASGEDFGDYGMIQYRYGKDYSRKLLSEVKGS